MFDVMFYFVQLLQACISWEDYLWAYFKVMVDVRVEQVYMKMISLGVFFQGYTFNDFDIIFVCFFSPFKFISSNFYPKT